MKYNAQALAYFFQSKEKNVGYLGREKKHSSLFFPSMKNTLAYLPQHLALQHVLKLSCTGSSLFFQYNKNNVGYLVEERKNTLAYFSQP